MALEFGPWNYNLIEKDATKRIARREVHEKDTGNPERFPFGQAANVAQAFGHDAAGLGENSLTILFCSLDFLNFIMVSRLIYQLFWSGFFRFELTIAASIANHHGKWFLQNYHELACDPCFV